MKIFNDIRFDNNNGDVFGGLTAAIVSLPLALAFGVASGAGPIAGLYGAVCVGLFAALFGGTPTLILEPTGPMTVVMTAVLTSLIANNPDQGLAMAFTVVMIAGVFQILLGAIKLGKYITLMPYSVISGFMSGIALKVGLNILDWSFVKRVHKVSWQAAGIMYGVMFLTIFVDLIVVFGLGVFIANIIAIEQLSTLQSKKR